MAAVGQLDPTPVETVVVGQLNNPRTLAKCAGARYDKRIADLSVFATRHASALLIFFFA